MELLSRIEPERRSRPGHLVRVAEPGYPNVSIMRICGDAGTPIAGLGGEWNREWSRHSYSRIRNGWSKTGKYVRVEQRSGGVPSELILDASDNYRPILGNRGVSRVSRYLEEASECRWSQFSDEEMIGINPSTQEIFGFNPFEDRELWRFYTGFSGQWMGEGDLSLDGSICALGTKTGEIVLVDLLNRRVGPVRKADFFFPLPSGEGLGNLTVSPLSTANGGRLVIKASGKWEYSRFFDFGDDLAPVPHALLPEGLRMIPESIVSARAAADGITEEAARVIVNAEAAKAGVGPTLSHADEGVTLDGREVLVGGVRNTSDAIPAYDKNRLGPVVAVHFETGLAWPVAPGSNIIPGGLRMASDEHCSCARKGYVLVSTYATGGTDRIAVAEVMELPLDGSRVPTWRAPHRSTGDPYAKEVQPNGSPDGRKCLIATDWAGVGSEPFADTDDVKSYVIEIGAVAEPAPVEEGPYGVIELSVNFALVDTRNGMLLHPSDVKKKLNRLHEITQAG